VVPARAAAAIEIHAETAFPLSDALVREMSIELANTLRDVIAKAVAQELARRRGPAAKP
jgi:hypothetical protein